MDRVESGLLRQTIFFLMGRRLSVLVAINTDAQLEIVRPIMPLFDRHNTIAFGLFYIK